MDILGGRLEPTNVIQPRGTPTMRVLILPALFALAACTTPGPVGVEVREVPVPTPVACVDASAIPAEPEHVSGKLTGQAAVDLAIVAASALELRRYSGELRALLSGCTD